MKSVLIRCDASVSIGSGHVMRCRTLARELHRRGAVVTFLCRRQPGDLIGLLAHEFSVVTLSELPLKGCEGLTGRELYEAWLGCSQEQDAADCLHALGLAGVGCPSWLVVDHYGLDVSWQALLLEGLAGAEALKPPKLLVIDDLADRLHKADLLLDQNFFGEVTDYRYQGLVSSQCRQLLGPHYCLLGAEYAQLHPLVPKRTERRRVLVFFGGVDPGNLTGRTLEALEDPKLAHLAVDVVLGHQSPHRQAVEKLVASRPHTNLYGPLPSLAGLIARADLAIGAGGSTCWERMALRLPSLVVTFGNDQAPIAEALDKLGNILLLGNGETVTVEQLRSSLLAVVAGASICCESAPILVDGYGTPRLATSMLGIQGSVSLRRADASDEALLLRWANDSQVRASSFSPDPINPSVHHNWFYKGLADPNRLLFIAEVDGFAIGQIRFDRQYLSVDSGSSEAMIDLSLDRSARGFGLAADLLRLGLQEMEQAWGPGIEAVADVLTINQASNACFRRSGFAKDPISPACPSPHSVNRWRRWQAFTNF